MKGINQIGIKLNKFDLLTSIQDLTDIFIIDPSNETTMLQERTGANASTIAQNDDPVGTISIGNGYYLIAPTDAARPIRKFLNQTWYLEANGVDHYMNISPNYSLGNEWSHVGAWKAEESADWAFTMSDVVQGGLRTNINNGWNWHNESGSAVIIASGDVTVPHILSLVRKSETLMSGVIGFNTLNEDIIIFDDSNREHGFALFTRETDNALNLFKGNLYYSIFTKQILSSSNITTYQTIASNRLPI